MVEQATSQKMLKMVYVPLLLLDKTRRLRNCCSPGNKIVWIHGDMRACPLVALFVGHIAILP
jgi:hypothetical protein